MGDKKPSSKECCNLQLLRYILFIFNFFFWLAGCAVLAIGLWTLIAKQHYISLLSTPLFAISTYLLIIAGGIVIILATIGCIGIHREFRAFLLTYILLLLLVFAVEVVAGLMAYLYRENIEEDLKHNLNSTFLDNYKVDDGVTAGIDSLQQSFACCGAVDYEDWYKSVWLKTSEGEKRHAPDSCCITYSDGCAAFLSYNHPSNIHDEGCIHAIKNEVKSHTLILCGVGLGFCLFQVLGALFGCCMYRQLSPSGKGYEQANH